MTRVIAVASQKGGVGKTTTAVNLGAYLAQSGASVLLMDLDPQGNATSGLSAAPASECPLEQLWTGELDWDAATSATEIPHLRVLASPRRPEIPSFLEDLRSPRRAELRAALLENPAWEIVLIDGPPSLGPLTSLALSWSDAVLIPVQCEYFAMEGLAQMIALIEASDAGRAEAIEIAGILLTLFDPPNSCRSRWSKKSESTSPTRARDHHSQGRRAGRGHESRRTGLPLRTSLAWRLGVPESREGDPKA